MYTYVVPNRSLIGLGRTERVIQKMNMTFSSYTGQWWEYYCRQAISGQDLFGSTWQLASRWWGSALNSEAKTNESIELDVVTMSDNKRKLLVGECKWTEGEYAERLFNNSIKTGNEWQSRSLTIRFKIKYMKICEIYTILSKSEKIIRRFFLLTVYHLYSKA